MPHTLNQKRIFTVDDDVEICDYLRRVISTKTIHEVVTFTNPQEALDEFKRVGAHLVITDLNMPHMDGISLLGHIKEVCPETEVILLTGEATVKSAVGAITHRAYDYIEKPVANDRLLRAIGNALNRQELTVRLEETVGKVAALNKELRKRVRDQAVRVTPLERLAMAAVMADIFTTTLEGHLSRARTALQSMPAASGKTPQGWALNEAVEGIARSIAELSSRIGRFHLDRSRGDLVALATEEITGYAEMFPHVDLITDRPSKPIHVDMDRQALSTALGHVMENAVQAIESNGTVWVKITSSDRMATIDVLDEGAGFPPEVFTSAPVPFLPGGPSAARWLGLALARLIVTAHGGQFQLSNRKDGGGQVRLTLPCEG